MIRAWRAWRRPGCGQTEAEGVPSEKVLKSIYFALFRLQFPVKYWLATVTPIFFTTETRYEYHKSRPFLTHTYPPLKRISSKTKGQRFTSSTSENVPRTYQ